MVAFPGGLHRNPHRPYVVCRLPLQLNPFGGSNNIQVAWFPNVTVLSFHFTSFTYFLRSPIIDLLQLNHINIYFRVSIKLFSCTNVTRIKNCFFNVHQKDWACPYRTNAFLPSSSSNKMGRGGINHLHSFLLRRWNVNRDLDVHISKNIIVTRYMDRVYRHNKNFLISLPG